MTYADEAAGCLDTTRVYALLDLADALRGTRKEE